MTLIELSTSKTLTVINSKVTMLPTVQFKTLKKIPVINKVVEGDIESIYRAKKRN